MYSVCMCVCVCMYVSLVMSTDLHRNGKTSFSTNLIKMFNYYNIPFNFNHDNLDDTKIAHFVDYMQKKYIVVVVVVVCIYLCMYVCMYVCMCSFPISAYVSANTRYERYFTEKRCWIKQAGSDTARQRVWEQKNEAITSDGDRLCLAVSDPVLTSEFRDFYFCLFIF